MTSFPAKIRFSVKFFKNFPAIQSLFSDSGPGAFVDLKVFMNWAIKIQSGISGRTSMNNNPNGDRLI